jgi:membrane-bound serine protease (ClpP class)
MKTRKTLYALLALTGASWLGADDLITQPAATGDETVYVIPIEGQINQSLVYTIRRGIAEAKEQDAAVLILDMDTPGGSVPATRQIMTALIAAGEEIQTCTFVNKWAISAGAFISVCTDDIYMAPLSQIGAAAPVMMSPLGGTQEMPDTMNEKMVSALSAVVRSAAEAKGHDVKLIEAMIRSETEYKIGDTVISKEGELLTLTNTEAERQVDDPPRTLLSKGTVKDLDELISVLGYSGATTVHLEISPAEKMARWIQMFSALFIGGGLLGLYIEFKTPGFGVFGIFGLFLVGVWFWANYIAGVAGAGEILAFMIGLLLLTLEIFVIPGFGITGIAGFFLMLAALLMAMVPHIPSNVPGLPAYPILPDIQISFLHLGLSMVLTMFSALILARYLPETQLFQHITLNKATDVKEGFDATGTSDDCIGLIGTAVTQLRPAGSGDFDGKRMSVVSRGEFIDTDSPIRIVDVRGNRVIVERTQA